MARKKSTKTESKEVSSLATSTANRLEMCRGWDETRTVSVALIAVNLGAIADYLKVLTEKPEQGRVSP